MATNTYVALQTQTVGSATANVTFSSIPQNYTDLRLVVTGAMTGAGYFYLQYNGDSASNYSRTEMYGYGSSTGSFRAANLIPISMDTTLGTCVNKIDIMGYSNTSTYKTCVYRSDLAAGLSMAGVGLWRSTAAINTISVIGYSTTQFVAGSSLTLYGIAAASSPQTSPKASGGLVYEDSSYWYHAFPTSSTFTPNQSLTADVLCVAGGGGGGTANRGGGGGAGGVIYFAGQSLTATGYSVTVGAGGAGFTAGSNSQFASLTVASGGGRGGRSAFDSNYLASAGGSGGGCGNNGTSGGASNQSSSGATAIYANAGGNVSIEGNSAGGGGAGAAGTNSTNTNDGVIGGIGTNAFASWMSATGLGQGGGYIAAGGNGGASASSGGTLLATRPLGGGGANSSTPDVANGIASTGSGGSGFSYNSGSGTYPAGSGGSGVIIVRYAK